MGTENDKKVKDLLNQIDKKRQELGTKPHQRSWKTNGVLRGKNINTITELSACVAETAQLLSERDNTKRACDFLGVPEQGTESSWLNDALDDLKLRSQIIIWEVEKKKLQALEARLKDLRSNDAKTEDALGDIASLLK